MTGRPILAVAVATVCMAPGCLPVRQSGASLLQDSVGGQAPDSGCGADAFAGQAGPHYFDLKSMIQANPSNFPDRTSVLATLSPAFRQNFALAYRSQSVQSSSPSAPRVIFFSDLQAPEMIIGVAGVTPAAGDDAALEIIEFSKAQRAFCFRSINFDQSGNATFDDQPEDCAGCHGADGRPLWEPYNTWPGIYGSRGGQMATGSIELNQFTAFASTPQTGTAYGLLPSLGTLTLPGPAGLTSFVNQTASGPPASPLAAITSGLNQLNFQRLSRLLSEGPLFDRYKYAILAAFVGCPGIDGFVPADLRSNHPQAYDAVLAQTKSLIDDADSAREARINPVNFVTMPGVDPADADALNPDYLNTIAALRYLLENRQANAQGMANWSMSHVNRAYAFDGGTTGITDLGHVYLSNAFTPGTDLYNAANSPALFSSAGRKTLDPSLTSSLCAQLQAASSAN